MLTVVPMTSFRISLLVPEVRFLHSHFFLHSVSAIPCMAFIFICLNILAFSFGLCKGDEGLNSSL